MQVENYNSELSVVNVSLINNEFDDLNIILVTTQSFELTNQVTGDTDLYQWFKTLEDSRSSSTL